MSDSKRVIIPGLSREQFLVEIKKFQPNEDEMHQFRNSRVSLEVKFLIMMGVNPGKFNGEYSAYQRFVANKYLKEMGLIDDLKKRLDELLSGRLFFDKDSILDDIKRFNPTDDEFRRLLCRSLHAESSFLIVLRVKKNKSGAYSRYSVRTAEEYLKDEEIRKALDERLKEIRGMKGYSRKSLVDDKVRE